MGQVVHEPPGYEVSGRRHRADQAGVGPHAVQVVGRVVPVGVAGVAEAAAQRPQLAALVHPGGQRVLPVAHGHVAQRRHRQRRRRGRVVVAGARGVHHPHDVPVLPQHAERDGRVLAAVARPQRVVAVALEQARLAQPIRWGRHLPAHPSHREQERVQLRPRRPHPRGRREAVGASHRLRARHLVRVEPRVVHDHQVPLHVGLNTRNWIQPRLTRPLMSSAST